MAETPTVSPAETYTQTPWGGVTDPSHHDPGKFRYLVHLDVGRAPDGTDPGTTPWEYFLENPDRLRSMPVISTSLVDQDHRVLYELSAADHGFILEVPESSVIATNFMDMFSKFEDVEILREKFPVANPDQLLAETKTTRWNEVAISPNGLLVKALFWVKNQTGEMPTHSRETVKKAAEAWVTVPGSRPSKVLISSVTLHQDTYAILKLMKQAKSNKSKKVAVSVVVLLLAVVVASIFYNSYSRRKEHQNTYDDAYFYAKYHDIKDLDACAKEFTEKRGETLIGYPCPGSAH